MRLRRLRVGKLHLRPGRLQRSGRVAQEAARAALALAPPAGTAARLVWHDYPSIALLGERPVTWVEVDPDGDGAADAELVVWCGSFVPSGCEGRVCREVCRGMRTTDGAEPTDVLCDRFIPDLDDCLPDDLECELVPAGLPPATPDDG